jgi:hypothetical protein
MPSIAMVANTTPRPANHERMTNVTDNHPYRQSEERRDPTPDDIAGLQRCQKHMH